MRDLGFKHAQFVDRLGDTFRWKGENVSTTEVKLALEGFDDVSESVVYGVEIPNTNGRAGMVSVRLGWDASQFDFKRLLARLRDQLPHYAVPLFLRLSDAMEITGTFKHKKKHPSKKLDSTSPNRRAVFMCVYLARTPMSG